MSKLIIEIENPHIDSERKLEKSLEILSKATKYKIQLDHGHSKSEPTPYRSLREFADLIHDQVEAGLFAVWSEIVTKWLGVELKKATDDPYKLNGKVFINPKTGKKLTQKEWKLIQTEMTRLFGKIYGDTQEAMVKQAIALGRLLNTMDPDQRIDTPFSKLNPDPTVVTQDQAFDNIITWAGVHTGELIQEITDKSRKKVVETIMAGYQDGDTARQLRTRLFDEFSTMNRDWRRIAETETAHNFNNGYLTAQLQNKPKDQDYQFMIGISGAGACSWCRSHVNNQVVVLLENPPAGGDQIDIDGTTYTAIWPGKDNFGRKRGEWWVASGAQHPHCRCTWTDWSPEFTAMERKLRDAMS